ncbi:hypothetical protein D9M68_480070 [compost metagenome]
MPHRPASRGKSFSGVCPRAVSGIEVLPGSGSASQGGAGPLSYHWCHPVDAPGALSLGGSTGWPGTRVQIEILELAGVEHRTPDAFLALAIIVALQTHPHLDSA